MAGNKGRKDVIVRRARDWTSSEKKGQYHQRRIQQAREHHARRKRQKLRALGIHVEKSGCCIQDNS
jgi:hypothetical protein